MKEPPPWAKQMRRSGGSRSNAPPRIIRLRDSWVSAGIATVQPSIQSSRRQPPNMSHGWTNTGAPSEAQWARNVTTPASSRSRSPTWLPIWTPFMPAARARSSSRQARSVSCSGTWQIGTSRPPPCEHSSSSASLKMRAHSMACSAGRAVGEQHRRGRDDLDVHAVAVHVGQAHRGVPTGRRDGPELPGAEHDHGAVGPVAPHPRPVRRAEALGQVGPGLGEEVGVQVDDGHTAPAAGARRGRAEGRAGRRGPGGPTRSPGRCGPPRRRRRRRRPSADRRPGWPAGPRRGTRSAAQRGQYHSKASTMPAGRCRSITRPTEPGTGRWGEWRTWGGRRKISPSRMGMSRGPPSSHTRRTMSPWSWWKNSSHGSSWKSVRWFGPPTTVTMKSPSAQIWALPTGGRSRSRCSSIQAVRLMGRLTGSMLTPSVPAGRWATALISMARWGWGSWCTATVVRPGPSRPRSTRRRPRCSPSKSSMVTRNDDTSTTSDERRSDRLEQAGDVVEHGARLRP